METKEILWYIIISVACILPIVLLVRSASAKSRLVTKSLKRILKKLPSEHDIWSGRGIAFDPLTRSIVYVNCDAGQEKQFSGELARVSKCFVKVNGRAVAEDKKTVEPKDVNTIELCFQMSGPKMKEENLLFFVTDPDGPFQSTYYYQLARKWRKRIGDEIGKQTKAMA